MATLRAAKKELRKKMRVALSGLSQDDITRQTSLVVKNLRSFPEYQYAKRVSIFLSMPEGEISTTAIVRDAFDSGKRVFVPYTHKAASVVDGQPNSIMDMVELLSLDDYESLESDSWGIPTPSPASIPSRQNSFGGRGVTDDTTQFEGQASGGLDLIVMPGMAFDNQMGRLGHGKGFYDYFLTRSLQHIQQVGRDNMPYLVGIALKEQLLPTDQKVPMGESDWYLNALVVGDGEILRAAG